ncbi:MAG: TonB family protein [Steroidobacteraceae bacterium]
MGLPDRPAWLNPVGGAAARLSVTAAFGVGLLAWPLSADGAGSQPPRALGGVSNAVDNCYRMHGRSGAVTGEVAVTVSVDAQGRITGATSPAGTPESLAAAAQCVAVTMRFEPATLEGVAVPGRITVDIGFPSAPALRQDLRRAIQYCQPAVDPLVTLNAAYEGELDLLVKVGKDGRVVETVVPEGVLPWMDEAARCVAGRLEFFPARLKLVAVESWATIPIDFNLSRNPHERVRLESPSVRSDDEAILDAYRECYPAGRDDQATINYRITVTEGGRVKKAEVVRSSGDEALDEVGICILRRLVFVPARRNGVNVESTLSWPILVRPAA